MCACTCGGQKLIRCVFLNYGLIFSIRQGLPENLELTDLARTTGQQAPAITPSASLALTPILALPVCATAPSFSYGCQEFNSGSHACSANILLTEPSAQLSLNPF